MHFTEASSNGPAIEQSLPIKSSALAFNESQTLPSLSGPTYVTAQSLVQQVAYTLSDKLFTYSPETFDLDLAAQTWAEAGQSNANGYPTAVIPMQIRNGAGTVALGYIFSKDFDLKRRHIPQAVIATSSGLKFLQSSLEQLSLLYSVANPFVAHIAAADYVGGKDGGLVSDYTSALSLADELGFGLVSSHSAHDSQHMALLATTLAQFLPTLNIYDGVHAGRQTTRVIDILDKSGLSNAYNNVMAEARSREGKHLDLEGKTLRTLKAFNTELGTDYSCFEYAGHHTPEAVLVTFGSTESSIAAQVANQLAKDDVRIGAINVRIYRPFVEEEFLKLIPASATVVGVLGQVSDAQAVQTEGAHSSLFEDVLAALSLSATSVAQPRAQEVKYAPTQKWSPVGIAAAFQTILGKPILENVSSSVSLVDVSDQQYVFWDVTDSPSAGAATVLAQTLAKDSASNVTTSTILDNLVQGGAQRTDIRKSTTSSATVFPVTAADTAIVGDAELLKKIDILRSVKTGGKLILKLPGTKDEDVEKKLTVAFRKTIAEREIKLFIIDPKSSEFAEANPAVEVLILETAFLRVALPQYENVGLSKLALFTSDIHTLEKISAELEKTLREIEVPKSWLEVAEEEQPAKKLPPNLTANSFVAFDKTEEEPPSILRDWRKVAKGLLFKEAYNTHDAIRPDLPNKTYTVHVKENRRLTPLTYERNIFHIEFELGTSGLKYDIGEALGIHAENDHDEVMEFIKFYGLNAEEVVEVAARDSTSAFENRTVYQSLMQNIDIFGRPPKRFYEALAEFASDANEKKTLLTLAGPEGFKEFQRRAEVDTITHADVLLEFPSAHPSFHDIVRIVAPMKRREYSIASCQAVTPTSVALMIVTVNWVDPKGRDRFGQATRYLNTLRPGRAVTVSVKPSVMKLPPKSTQPLIMAGLGTGLAPFRAFVQHRAMEKAQGKDIGSVLLYMGSRHQREEYCYGEEWEAYQAAGVITLLGRAFSRDQPQKIYIQDRMRETLDDIIQAYIKEEGAFYLCGPTWPVPDVTNVLEDAIGRDAKRVGKKVDPRKEIDRLKEELRYVLEVY